MADNKQANQDYFLDSEGNVTTDTEKAATLLIRSGQDIPQDMADKYGDALSGKVARQTGKAAEAEVADEAEEAAPTAKRAAKASANKRAATPAKNKGAK